MDRFSIIQKQLFDHPVVDEKNQCGENICECDENQANKKDLLTKADTPLLLIIVVAAFLSAFVSAGNMNEDNSNVLAKRYNAFSCYSAGIERSSDKKMPGDKNNQNNCSHQQSSLCESTNTKRKPFKPHNC